MLHIKGFSPALALFFGLGLAVSSSPLAFATKVAYAEKEEYINEVEPFSNYDESKNVLNFVGNNLSRFVEEYNKTIEENYLYATSIEYSKIIKLVEDSQWGVYIDFNENNGYTVITSDYKVYELQTLGDLLALRNVDEIQYSYIDGFLCVGEDGVLQKIFGRDEEAVGGSSMQVSVGEPLGGGSEDKIYKGQTSVGDGEINPAKITDYVAERYPDYTFVSKVQNLSATFTYCRQFSTSYYKKCITDESGSTTYSTYSEANCVLNATYLMLLNWQQQGFVCNLPTSTADLRESIFSDPLYSYYGTGIVRSGSSTSKAKTGASSGDEEVEYYKWETNDTYLRNMPVLYTEVRDRCVNEYSYTPESNFAFSKARNVAEYVANTLHGNDIDVKSALIFSNALDYLHENKAVFMGINGSSTYNDHGVVLIGYYKYSYESGWWIFASTKYAYFYEIADGWNSSAMFFDPNTSANPSLSASYLA